LLIKRCDVHGTKIHASTGILKEGTGSTKTSQRTDFFGGNTVEAFKTGLLPLLK